MFSTGILAVIIIILSALLGSQAIIWTVVLLIIWRINRYDHRNSWCNRKRQNSIYD